MKRILFVMSVMTVLSFSFTSCEMTDLLANYEEQLSMTSEEWDQYVPGKWKLSDAGFSTYQDDTYGEDRIDKDGYPEVKSSIESIEVIDRNIAVINFKGDVPFEVNLLDEGTSTTRTYSRFDCRTVPGILYLGFDWDGNEYFTLYEYETGSDTCILQWDIYVYGTETLGGKYNVKRMIISAGVSGESSYYEFVPAGK